MLVSGYQTDLFKYFFCLTNNQYSLCFSLSSRARTASGFLSSWACGSSSSPSSCSVMSSPVWFPKPCGSAMMPGTSSSWFFSPFPTDTWPASACALDPSKDCSPTNHKPIGAGGEIFSACPKTLFLTGPLKAKLNQNNMKTVNSYTSADLAFESYRSQVSE